MSIAAPLPNAIRDKLSAMARQQRELALVRGLGEFLFLSSLAVGLCLWADQTGNLSASARTGCLAGLAAVILLLGWSRVLRPVFRRRSWTELAAAVEQQHPELSERLTSLVELQADGTPTGSTLMRDLLARQTVKAVSQVDFTQALPAGKSLQRAALGLAALAVLLIPFLLPGGKYLLSWNRLLNPWGNYDWGPRLAFHVLDGDRVVAKGTDVTVEAELEGTPASAAAPLDVRLHWVDVAGHTQQRPMTWNAEDEIYAWTIPRVEQSFRFQLVSPRAVSRKYHVTAAERPRVTAWNIDVQPPAYAGLPAQALGAVVGELRVPEQSQLRFRWHFAEPVASVVIHWPEAFLPDVNPAADEAPQAEVRNIEIELTLSADRRSATAQLLATASGRFEIELTSDLGLRSEEPPHQLTIIPDLPPDISLQRDEAIASVRPDDVLPISISAEDDYGLAAVELHWRTSAGEQGQIAIPAAELNGLHLEAMLELDLSDLNLLPGQSVSCRAKAVDNRPHPGPQESWSEPWEISISADTDPLESRQLAAAQELLEQRLEELERAVTLQKQAVDTEHRDTAREAVRGDQPPENQAELEKLQQRQQELREQLESLRQELDQRPFLEKTAAEHLPRIEQQLADAQQSLQKAGEANGARDQIEQLSKSLDALGAAEDQLAKLKQESKSLAALEQELAALGQLSRQAEKLADRAESLDRKTSAEDSAKSQKTAEASPDKGNPKQNQDSALAELAKEPAANTAEELEALRRETEDLAEHVSDLLRRRPELLESARQNELERLSRLAEMAQRLTEPQGKLADAIAHETSPAKNSNDKDPSKPQDSGDQPASKPNAEKPSQPETKSDKTAASQSESKTQASDSKTQKDAGTSKESKSETDAQTGDTGAKSQESGPPQKGNENGPTKSQSGTDQPESKPNSEKSSPSSAEKGQNAGSPNDSKTQNDSGDSKESKSANPQTGETGTKSQESAAQLAAEIARATKQQQQLAREAAQLQREAESAGDNAKPSQRGPNQANPAAEKSNAGSGEAKSPLAELAAEAQAASQAAQAGDLKQAAEQSQAASEAAREAAQSAAAAGNPPNSPTNRKTGELADRQQALAEEFSRLAESPAARQAAQQQSQQQLTRTAEALAKALEQAAERLSQQPLDLPQPGRNAEQANESAQSAGKSMQAALDALQQGDSQQGGEQAQAAREQLQQAAAQASQAGGEPPATSPQGQKVPGSAASQVAQAAAKLQQAQSNLGNAEKSPRQNPGPSPDASSSPKAPAQIGTESDSDSPPSGEKPAAAKESGGKESSGKESGGKESGGKESGGKESGGKESGGKESGGKESGGKESSSRESGGKESGGKGSDDKGSQQNSASATQPEDAPAGQESSASGDSQTNDSAVESSKPGTGNSPSPLERSAEQLRQAARALAAASKAGQPGSPGKKSGSPGKPGRKGESGPQGEPAPSLAREDSAANPEPGNVSEPTEGFSEFGTGSAESSDELDAVTESPRPAAGSRNWGRLPKNLQTEIRQGSTKKPHPEYARQIKRYFEQIAQPAEKRKSP